MDLQRAFNEANARLRGIQEQLCCGSGTYNSLDVVSVTSTANKVFLAGTIHSVAWNLGSGASVEIAVNGGTPVSFTKEGSIEFSTYNTQDIQIEAVGGTISLIWTY